MPLDCCTMLPSYKKQHTKFVCSCLFSLLATWVHFPNVWIPWLCFLIRCVLYFAQCWSQVTLSNSSEGKVFEMTFSARNFIETICDFSFHFRDSLFCNEQWRQYKVCEPDSPRKRYRFGKWISCHWRTWENSLKMVIWEISLSCGSPHKTATLSAWIVLNVLWVQGSFERIAFHNQGLWMSWNEVNQFPAIQVSCFL